MFTSFSIALIALSTATAAQDPIRSAESFLIDDRITAQVLALARINPPLLGRRAHNFLGMTNRTLLAG